MKPTARCICPTVFVLDEEHVEWPEPDCPRHGRPADSWRAGDPLRRHALVVDRETGERLTSGAAHERLREPGETSVDFVLWERTYRDEKPRETEARLLRELEVVSGQEEPK